MLPLLLTLSDLWPRFQGHDIFKVEYRKICASKTKLLLHKRKLCLAYGMVLFGDLDWPPNASRRFVSISWASCFIARQHTHRARYALPYSVSGPVSVKGTDRSSCVIDQPRRCYKIATRTPCMGYVKNKEWKIFANTAHLENSARTAHGQSMASIMGIDPCRFQ